MSATIPSRPTNRQWSVVISATTLIAAVANGGALTAYLLNQTSAWLIAVGQFSLLIALLAWLRVILLPSVRSSLRAWLAPLTVATVIALYLTLATPG